MLRRRPRSAPAGRSPAPAARPPRPRGRAARSRANSSSASRVGGRRRARRRSNSREHLDRVRRRRPVASVASSAPTRTSWSSGNCSSAPVPVSIESAGIASVSRTAAQATTETTGRRITRAVQRSQKPSALGIGRAAAAGGGRTVARRMNESSRPDRPARPRPGGRGCRISAGSRVDGDEHRDRDDDHRPERHRAQRLVVDHPEPGERDHDRHAGEGDREPRGRERLGARLGGALARRAPPRGSGRG